MRKATSTIIAAVAALTLSGGAFAQNNTLATPSVTSPAAATSGYGTPSASGSDSGSAGATNSAMSTGPANSAKNLVNAPGSHNTLATPGVASPAAQ